MKKYEVTMYRKSDQEKVFYVNADNEDEAVEKAYDTAGDYIYSEVSAEYELEDIIAVEDYPGSIRSHGKVYE